MFYTSSKNWSNDFWLIATIIFLLGSDLSLNSASIERDFVESFELIVNAFRIIVGRRLSFKRNISGKSSRPLKKLNYEKIKKIKLFSTCLFFINKN